MNTATKIALVAFVGCTIGFVASCSLILDFTPIPSQCWCGEQWQAQIAGATAYTSQDEEWNIPASATTYTRCVSMLEHLALDDADPQDPVYMALHNAFESEAIANCELAGATLLEGDFDHTDCATTGIEPVATNLVYLGPCWEWEDLEAEPQKTCPLEDQCGQFYDCSDDPIILWNGQVLDGGTDGGETGGDEGLWSCDEPRASFEGPNEIRL